MKLALVVLFGCGDPQPTPQQPPAPPPRDAVDAIAASPPLLRDTHDLVTAVIADWNATTVTLRHYHRDGSWVRVGDPWPGVIGSAGAAWGSGLHGTGAPPGRAGPIKREGDDRSPAGAFALTGAYGDATSAPRGTQLRYTRSSQTLQCVDDPASSHYAQILDRRAGAVDWHSAEDMHRSDVLYRWVIDVAHNPARTPAGGSCIFLHVWGGPTSPTIGCTAMAEAKVAELVATLAPTAIYVLLPEAEYRALAPAWGLPPL